ncbi:hypothetical protein A0H81_04246 [Grifola frondosa]|uniref:RRM domain-containing protein n=1 Tax=Grifola frondosa TaxID=5627 RepID=A0A1C7MDN9_GRIFR|nr:hypothetical protein A0H81_04246 [Grifola frondosa]
MASTGTTNSFRRAARSFPRARSTAKPNQRTHILIRDIPRTALPSDLLRLCSKSKAENVSQVSLQYNRFRPSGRAYITVNDPMHLPSTLKALQSSMLGGKMTSSTSRDPPNLPPRNRGAEGRAEAAERGLITGNGPDAGVTNGGRNVVMWGLPSRITQENVRDMLKSFKLAGFEGGQEEMVKLEM